MTGDDVPEAMRWRLPELTAPSSSRPPGRIPGKTVATEALREALLRDEASAARHRRIQAAFDRPFDPASVG